MNQHQLDMGFGQRSKDLLASWEAAWGQTAQHVLFKLLHQRWDMSSGRKEKTILADIHLSIVSRPVIHVTKPDSMTVAEVCGSELMVFVETSDQDIQGPSQGTGLGIIHISFGSDAEP